MSARSGVAISVLLLSVAACESAQPAASLAPARTAAASAAASAAPTPAATPATVTPAPTARVGLFANPDGSTFLGLPNVFAHAQPSDGGIWGVLTQRGVDRDVVRVDPETFEIEVFLDGLPILPNPIHGVSANGFFWMSSWDTSSVRQYEVETGDLVREIPVGEHPVEPVLAYGDVWTLDHHGDSVTRIDVDSGETRSVSLPGALPLRLTPVGDDLMLVNGAGLLTYVVDPATMKLVRTYPPSGCYEAPGWHSHAIDGSLWRKRCDVEEVAILDPRTGKVLETLASPIRPSYEPLVVDGIWWFPTAADYTAGNFALAGFDPETREIVGTWTNDSIISEGWAFAAFDAWWRYGDEGILRVPADTLRAAIS